MEKNIMTKIWEIVNMVAFGLLLLAGLNFLCMGLFDFNPFNGMFGDSVTGRVIYSLFGISSLIILGTIIWKAFMPRKSVKVEVVDSKKPAVASSTSSK